MENVIYNKGEKVFFISINDKGFPSIKEGEIQKICITKDKILYKIDGNFRYQETLFFDKWHLLSSLSKEKLTEDSMGYEIKEGDDVLVRDTSIEIESCWKKATLQHKRIFPEEFYVATLEGNVIEDSFEECLKYQEYSDYEGRFTNPWDEED